MEKQILHSVEEGIRAIQFLKDPLSLHFIKEAAHKIAACFQRGGKLLIAGNGGSLCDAMHFAEELTGVFREKRRALPAIALSCPGHLTCTANDLGYNGVFARGVEAYGKPGDIFIALTTSGNSVNLIEAMNTAKSHGLETIASLPNTGQRGFCRFLQQQYFLCLSQAERGIFLESHGYRQSGVSLSRGEKIG